MNYLAHAYLSFNHPTILLGNMISDYVKGKKQFDYPAEVQKGIRLHRAIDKFTDEHIITKELKKIFLPQVGLYAGAFIDIVYDHFLATSEMTEKEWMIFSQNTYNHLDSHQHLFPEKFAKLFPYMREQNWLYNYRFIWGIENSFGGLVRRAKYLDNSTEAFNSFNIHYQTLEKEAFVFIKEVKEFTQEQFDLIIQTT